MIATETRRDVRQQLLTDIIRNRRSVYADDYTNEPIPEAIIREVLTNATWAPTYKMTQPWRFIVLQGNQRKPFGEFLAEYYRERLNETVFTRERYERAKAYPERAACMVVLIMRRNDKIDIKEWEELAAVCCAVQNMALTCEAYDIGAYWDSCDACVEYAARFGLESNEQCLGFFYMGYYDKATYSSPKRRTPIDKKVTWLY
ncbi:nitroreductase [Chitinophaga sp. sic0106]|uniref:nitroreductase family protein n=1 Tax=Chitinophaga sp. sic0106 TaxID=2854785 RepID=UPI001C47C382|nr:nitroreductase [Chitinophaga sp. sic0106]MBV7530030.1 nitroreductase [Chitinophaga sp. sic0106]